MNMIGKNSAHPCGSGRFQSTHPGWGATIGRPDGLKGRKFQSTHPGWGATDLERLAKDRQEVSIHAPRVGCGEEFPREIRP